MSRTPTNSETPVSKRQRTRAQWAREIAARWNKSKEAVIATGRALLEAKADLRAGIFLEMIEQDLPFSTRSAQRFMKIASDPRLSDAAYAPFLPSAWTALYELIKLSDEEFAQALKSGLINPKMTRNDVVKLSSNATPMWVSGSWRSNCTRNVANPYTAWTGCPCALRRSGMAKYARNT